MGCSTLEPVHLQLSVKYQEMSVCNTVGGLRQTQCSRYWFIQIRSCLFKFDFSTFLCQFVLCTTNYPAAFWAKYSNESEERKAATVFASRLCAISYYCWGRLGLSDRMPNWRFLSATMNEVHSFSVACSLIQQASWWHQISSSNFQKLPSIHYWKP